MMLGSLFAHNEPPASLETTRRKEIQPNEENVLRVTKGGSASIDLLVVVFFFFVQPPSLYLVAGKSLQTT